jgi:hypothetical protein
LIEAYIISMGEDEVDGDRGSDGGEGEGEACVALFEGFTVFGSEKEVNERLLYMSI